MWIILIQMWIISIGLACFLLHYSSCMDVTPVASAPPTNLAFSIIWDDCTQSVYYVDFLTTGEQNSIFRYDYNEDKVYAAYIEGYSGPSFILPVHKECDKFENIFSVGIGHFNRLVKWDGRSPVAKVVGTIFAINTDDPLSVLNSARQNQQGRFYGGTFHVNFCAAPANSSFYTYTPEIGLQRLFGDLQSTTGVASDLKARKLYHTDSCRQLITSYESNLDGDICNGRILHDFSHLGPDLHPIGADTDKNGNVYTGIYGGGTVWRINPKTKTAEPIADVGAGKPVGGCAFGGKNRDILFVAVGVINLNVYTLQPIQRIDGPSLYKITGVAVGDRYKRVVIDLKWT